MSDPLRELRLSFLDTRATREFVEGVIWRLYKELPTQPIPHLAIVGGRIQFHVLFPDEWTDDIRAQVDVLIDAGLVLHEMAAT